MKKYIEARKLEEGNKIPTPNPIPSSRPNANMPPILPKKQNDMSQPTPTGQVNLTRTDTEGVTADALESESEGNPPDVSDEDRRVLNALRFFYPDRHINMAHAGHSSSLVKVLSPLH